MNDSNFTLEVSKNDGIDALEKLPDGYNLKWYVTEIKNLYWKQTRLEQQIAELSDEIDTYKKTLKMLVNK